MSNIHYSDEEFKHNLDIIFTSWKKINKSVVHELNEYNEQIQIESELFSSSEKIKSYKPTDKIILIFYACWVIISAFKFVAKNLKESTLHDIDFNIIKYFRDIGVSLYSASKNLLDKQFFGKESIINDFDISFLTYLKEKTTEEHKMIGGISSYKQKYYMYKQKYLELKKKLKEL